jgi:CheY-like chemotaxis protein
MAKKSDKSIGMKSIAGIIAFDLVKSSQKQTEDAYKIKATVQDVVTEAVTNLSIKEYTFNDTGDGFLISLLNQSSVKLIDFACLFFPLAESRLLPYSQNFRAGMDLGVVNLVYNPVSNRNEHFDQPGIRAARLEGAAQEGEILATDTVCEIFRPLYPGVFLTSPASVKCKDRKLLACPLQVKNLNMGYEQLRNYLLGLTDENILSIGKRNGILVVDDEPNLLELLQEYLTEHYPDCSVTIASDGKAALEMFEKGKFLVVVTDVFMPAVNGFDLTEKIVSQDEEVFVIVMSGYAKEDSIRSCYLSGGVAFLSKPLSLRELSEFIELLCRVRSAVLFRSLINQVSNKPYEFIDYLFKIREGFRSIVSRTEKSDDPVHGLLRHKGKQILNDFLEHIRLNQDITETEISVDSQLRKLNRLIGMTDIKNEGGKDYVSCQKTISDLTADLAKNYPKSHFTQIPMDVDIKVQKQLSGLLILVIAELVHNAVEASGGSGEITIETDYNRTFGKLVIKVSDNGPGLSKKLEKELFKREVSTKGLGRGLGLSLIYRSLSIYEGSIAYERNGKTTFIVELPYRDNIGV